MKPAFLSLKKTVKKQLEALLRSEKNSKQWRKYRAILLCMTKERSFVAESLGIDSRTLRRWISSFIKNGINGLKIKKPPGRPPTITEEKQAQIVKTIDGNPYGWSTKQLRESIHKQSGILYSKRHIYRIAQKWGFSEVRPRPMDRRRSKSAVYQFKKRQKE